MATSTVKTAAKLTITSTLPLPNSSLQIPQLGFGVYQSHGPTCIKSCTTAIKVGYRKIDSAQYYDNEALVHDAVISDSASVARSDLWLTTKILFPGDDAKSTYRSVADSVEKLGGAGGYADLFLIHNITGGAKGRKLMWQALERAYDEGSVKAIGVSNWGIQHMEEIKSYAKIWPPHVLQIELHPWCQQREVVSYAQRHGIVVEAYCPLVRGMKNDDKTLVGIAEKVGKGPGQVLVRYCLQKGWSPLPKSDTPERIQGNADVFGWGLDEADMRALDGLDQGAEGALVEVVDNGT